MVGYFTSAVSVALTTWFLFLFVDMMMDYIKTSARFRAWGAMISMVFAVMAGLIFIIFVAFELPVWAERGLLARRFLRVLAVQLFLFFLLEGLRVLLFLPFIRAAGNSLARFWTPISYVNALGGVLLAAAALVGSVLIRRRNRRDS